jgi:predicted nucleic acid-binding protein
MTCLLDVSALLAPGDRKHPNQEKVESWLISLGTDRWATCPITENGFVRIQSQPSYKNSDLNPAQARVVLRQLCDESSHQFRTDDLSIRDETVLPEIPGPDAVTDLYLLA